MLKIRSTEKLATSNTNGKCDVERTVLQYIDTYNKDGVKERTTLVIKSTMFKERTVEVPIEEVSDGGASTSSTTTSSTTSNAGESSTTSTTTSTSSTTTTSTTQATRTVKQRMYVAMNNDIREWSFTAEEVEAIETQLADAFVGKTEEEKRLIAFIAQTKTAGDDENGWQGMNVWIPDTEEYEVVETFN